MIDDKTLMAVFTADLGFWNQECPGPLPSLVATRLIDRGYPESVAVRAAMTPRMIVFRPDCPVIGEDLPRPGRDIAESIEHNTPIVVQALLYGTLAVRCPREAGLP